MASPSTFASSSIRTTWRSSQPAPGGQQDRSGALTDEIVISKDSQGIAESQEGSEDDAAALRRRMTGVLAGLPEALKKHLEALMALERKIVEGAEARGLAEVDRVGEKERLELEESLRRLARSLRGGLTHKRTVSSRGRIDSGRTMRRNMRFDGIPFAPVAISSSYRPFFRAAVAPGRGSSRHNRPARRG